MHLAGIIDGHPADDVALISRGRTTTYGELRDQTARVAGALVDAGIVEGDRVGLMCGDNWYFCVGLLGALHAGAVVVPINPRSPRAEMEPQLRTVGARAVLLGASAAARLAADGTTRPDLELVVAPEDSAIEADLPWSIAHEGPAVERRGAGGDEPALLMWTSGTAGWPRAATLTHRNVLANHEQLRAQDPDAPRRDDVILAVLPFSHVYGVSTILTYGLGNGSRMLLVENFDPVNAVESIGRHGVTSFPVVPPMVSALLDLPGLTAADLEPLRRVTCGGSSLAPEAWRAFRERFGIPILEGYGLTEASPVVTSSSRANARPGSVGRPLPGVEVRLVDEEGEDALPGDPGEVLVRGENVFQGYWGDPDATALVLDPEGWLHTGDIGVVDDDGCLRLVDRSKDLVIVSGFNVFPAEVEEALRRHPAVEEVGVVGVPHPHTGEAVVAHVVVADGHDTDEDQLIEHCAHLLPRYKAPSKIRFVEELPRNDAGKLARRLLGEGG